MKNVVLSHHVFTPHPDRPLECKDCGRREITHPPVVLDRPVTLTSQRERKPR